jgi:hypothetical protein
LGLGVGFSLISVLGVDFTVGVGFAVFELVFEFATLTFAFALVLVLAFALKFEFPLGFGPE